MQTKSSGRLPTADWTMPVAAGAEVVAELVGRLADQVGDAAERQRRRPRRRGAAVAPAKCSTPASATTAADGGHHHQVAACDRCRHRRCPSPPSPRLARPRMQPLIAQPASARRRARRGGRWRGRRSAGSRRSARPSRASRRRRRRRAGAEHQAVVERRARDAAGGRDRLVERPRAGERQRQRLQRRGRSRRDRRAPSGAHSRRSAILTGREAERLAQVVARAMAPPRGRARRAATSASLAVRGRGRASAARRRAGRCGERVDAAALDAARPRRRTPPRRCAPPAVSRTGLTGAPKWRAIAGDQATRKPTFDGRNGASVTPSRGEDRAPRRRPSRAAARRRRRARAPSRRRRRARAPSGVAKRARRRPASRASASGCGSATPARLEPAESRRAAAARPSSPRGKTRPELPVKTSTPSPSRPGRDLRRAEVGEDRREPVAALGVGGGEGGGGSALVRFSPDLPAIRSLRPSVGLRLGDDARGAPAAASASAAISPAGPPPITSASDRSRASACRR